MRRSPLTLAALLVFAAAPALRAQAMPGMDMSSASESMSGPLMPMAHMTMTSLAKPHGGDADRAAAIVDTLKVAIEKYRDYRVALDDGFTIFLPKIPQKIYHFTSKSNAIVSRFHFDAARPTSLLYRRNPDGGYTLVGAMYTAPKRATLDELDERVPLSVAAWHMHTNLCLPPKGEGNMLRTQGDSARQFGLRGTIVTQAACDAAGGRFFPTVFGWMVHVQPWETDPKLVWGTHEHEHGAMTGR